MERIFVESLENVQITIGRIEEEEEEWEPLGPTPFPSITSLRQWDQILLKRYKPFYSPFCDLCCLCTYGKCDLTKKKGACGIDIGSQQSRIVLLACCMGTAAHSAHARHLLEFILKRGNKKIDLGLGVEVEAPIMRTVTGIKPRTLGDLEKVLSYAEEQIVHCLSATNTGQESSQLDFESKALHVGMVDNLVKEVADILQIVGFGFPKGDPEAPLVEIGLGSVDVGKPVILCIGHNVAPGKEIIDYLRRKNLLGKVEICGICCTAHDLTRYEKGAKIIGPLSRQIHFIRSGVADVIVVDEQCVRTDILEEAKRLKIPVIATSDKICYGLPDMTSLPAGEIVERISGEFPGAFLLDPEKVGEVATEVALRISPSRSEMKKIPQISTLVKLAGSCTKCDDCRRLCPYDLPIPEAMESAKKGDVSMLGGFWDVCGGCGRCNSCRRKLPVSDMIFIASQHLIRKSRARLRSGRGPIQDTEIREVGRPIVFGEIPGVIAYVGCANYPAGWKELAKMAEEFLQRRYIVVASGCSAMDLAMQKDEEGRSLYEKYPGAFDASNLTNVGSCVANAHIIGAAIKIANIFAKRNLRANFEEIADYILGRVGACGVAWGAMSQKAAAIATGCNRWGIPVIIGPHGSKYRRLYLGRKDIKEDWMVYDVRREGELSYFGPAPEHLLYSAETAEEAIVMTAKLCIRANDTTMGRQIKLTHYLDLYEKYFGGLPDDWWMLVRTRADLPIVRRDELLRELDRMGWKPSPIPDPTNLERFKMGWK